MTDKWTPQSWRQKPAEQLPVYPDRNLLQASEKKLHRYPPLVTIDEISQLKADLTKVSEQKAFLLQGGDCAETFSEFNHQTIRDTFRVFLQMPIILNFVGKKNIIRIGRFAGQFAKPRSAETETRDGVTRPIFRGDIINGSEFTEKARTPNPKRILQAYFQSTSTLNFLRAFSHGKYADLDQMLTWMLGYIKSDQARAHYDELEKRIRKTLSFVSANGITKEGMNLSVKNIDFYTSHEALLLYYEEPLVRQDPLSGDYFASSAHFLWLGDRTRDPGGAHVEFLRGIVNPIGIKCGPSLTTDDLRKLLEVLNPKNEQGRITLISRMGQGKVEKGLRPLLKAVKASGHHVVWSCDPMHGNTKTTPSGQKTRYFDDIYSEISDFFKVCREENVYPGSIHLEMTGKNVTECLGGSKEVDLTQNYETLCDPRLNGEQALELAFRISELLGPIS